jgi:hypothetical protein
MIVKKSLRVLAAISGIALGAIGLACLVVSARVFETSDGFYVTLGSRTYALPDRGMLGDFGTYSTEWGMLGLFCIAGSALIVITTRVRRTVRLDSRP